MQTAYNIVWMITNKYDDCMLTFLICSKIDTPLGLSSIIVCNVKNRTRPSIIKLNRSTAHTSMPTCSFVIISITLDRVLLSIPRGHNSLYFPIARQEGNLYKTHISTRRRQTEQTQTEPSLHDKSTAVRSMSNCIVAFAYIPTRHYSKRRKHTCIIRPIDGHES